MLAIDQCFDQAGRGSVPALIHDAESSQSDLVAHVSSLFKPLHGRSVVLLNALTMVEALTQMAHAFRVSQHGAFLPPHDRQRFQPWMA